MTVVLLANVGSRDVHLTDPSLLPEEMQAQGPGARKLGEELLENIDRYAGAIELPLIGVSLRWLLEQEGVDPDTLYVHLFASDQLAPPTTPETEWLKDSVPFARVVQRLLLDGHLEWRPRYENESRHLRLPKRRVRIHSLQGNPADYRNVLDYFTGELPSIERHLDEEDEVYLEVTGGTPAMTSMLILAGVDTFGRRARTLYVDRGADRPRYMGIGRRLFSRRTRAALDGQLDLYAYAVAGATLEEEKDHVVPDVERQRLVLALLDYADRRLAFDFERARRALHEAGQYASGENQAQVQAWERELRSRDGAAMLGELVHNTVIKYELGSYADFTQRLFRFQEAILRHLARRMGMEHAREGDDRYVSVDWVENVPGLRDFLEAYVVESGNEGIALHVPLNRVSLGAIVEFFVERDPDWAFLSGVVEDVHRLSSLARLRNKGLAGHGFQGIGREDLEAAWGEDPDRILSLLEEIYAAVFDRPVGPSPYETVNRFIRDCLAG